LNKGSDNVIVWVPVSSPLAGTRDLIR